MKLSTILYSENYFVGDLTRRYLPEELCTRILMESAEMHKLGIQVSKK
jgi:hypothetical protein